jgi:MFS superfamily sulfate permease-like transporter
VGLYAAPAALLLYAAFGSSRHLVTGPMSATAALSAAAVAQLATQGSGRFVQLTMALGDAHGPTLALGLVSLALVLGLRRPAPVVPGSLVAVLFGIVVVWALGLDERGVDIVGHIDSGLSSLGLPEMAAADYLALAPSAIGVMLVGFAEGLGAAKTYAAQHHYEVDANRELLGLGAANLGAGLSSGMLVNGSLSKTAVNGSAGARSQVSGLVVAALTVPTLLFLTGPRALMWPCSARSPGPTATTATSSATPRTGRSPGSWSCAWRAGCSSPTPTPSAPTPPSRRPGRWCSTPRRSRMSTSPRPGC